MAQIKIYGLKEKLAPVREELSAVIHSCVMEALLFPTDKRAHQFFLMNKEDFFAPAGRTEAYTIIEISMIEGRSVDAKKKLIRLLFDNIRDKVGIQHQDIEICIYESPACNWGFRGIHGDEVALNYKINV
ncbi:MAG: tautomerase family protein [Methylococcales bacterium]|nr:tautomerase family protein [Methylococcales bacterium]PPD47055.1 MAG: tautomerase family protein [Methylotenera sp.]